MHELRRERGLTIRRLAEAAGVHHTYVSKLERGDRQAPEEPVVEALAAALGATPAQLDQLRWRAGISPRGTGAPGSDDPTLTLVAEALGEPGLNDATRHRIRQTIAQVVQALVPGQASQVAHAAPAPPPYASPPYAPSAGMPPASLQPVGASPTGNFPGQPAPVPPSAPAAWQMPPMPQVPPGYPSPAPPYPAAYASPTAPGYGYPPTHAPAPASIPMPAGFPVPNGFPPVPEAPVDTRAALLASMMGGWQTVDEAAAELRVTPAYITALVQSGQLRAWALPGGVPGSGTALRLRREDVLGLLQPVQLMQSARPAQPGPMAQPVPSVPVHPVQPPNL